MTSRIRPGLNLAVVGRPPENPPRANQHSLASSDPSSAMRYLQAVRSAYPGDTTRYNALMSALEDFQQGR